MAGKKTGRGRRKRFAPPNSPRSMTSSEEGKRDEFEAVAVKEVLAWRIEQAMREKNISRNNLAQRMKTSRSQSAACSTRRTATSR